MAMSDKPWKKVSNTNTVAIRTMDRTCFEHHQAEIIFKDSKLFFDVGKMERDSNNKGFVIKIKCEGEECKEVYIRTREREGKPDRPYLFWNQSSLKNIIEKRLPGWYEKFHKDNDRISDYVIPEGEGPLMRFKKQDDKTYSLDFIYPHELEPDIEPEVAEEMMPEQIAEGKVKLVYSKQYERNPKNTKMAKEIHGTKCKACGFDFGMIYGTRGMGFVEVHHTKPLSTVNEERLINPATDLAPVCSNCHRMIHCSKDNVLSIEELRDIIEAQRKIRAG